MVGKYVKFNGLWMTEKMRQDIIDLTDDFYADTMRKALKIGLKKMSRRAR